jgi:hypothetical protein
LRISFLFATRESGTATHETALTISALAQERRARPAPMGRAIDFSRIKLGLAV